MTALTPTVRKDARVERRQPDESTRARTLKPITPSDTLRAPFPPRSPGCFHLVRNTWVAVRCATEEYKSWHPLPPPVFANGIESTAHANPLSGNGQPALLTVPFVFGSIVLNQISNPAIATEADSAAGANAFSIQTNTNTFTCSTCQTGYPFSATAGFANSASQPGDTGWVQFVYQQGPVGKVGIGNSALCVWNVDTTVANTTGNAGGYASTCVYPSATEAVLPLDGPGAATGAAQVLGYVQCPNPNTSAGCTLWAVAQLPWSPGSGWWSISAPDTLGLAGNWDVVSGGMFGIGGSTTAVFTNTQLQTVVSAYGCMGPPSATGYTVEPCPGPPTWDREGQAFNLTGSPADYLPTGETNNLDGGPVTFSCGELACWMGYIASH